MAYWLFKTEPESWSWDEQVARGSAGEEWTGVRNHAAKNNMLAMKAGDLGFFYHSGEPKCVVGVVRVKAAAHPDTTDAEGRWFSVDVEAVEALRKPVTLAQVKADARLQDMALVKLSRLSVQPVTPEEWEIVCAMGGLKAAR